MLVPLFLRTNLHTSIKMLSDGRGSLTDRATLAIWTDHRKLAKAVHDGHPTASTPDASHTGAEFIDLTPACRSPRDMLYGALSANAVMKSLVIFFDDSLGGTLSSLMVSVVFLAVAADAKYPVGTANRYAR